MASRQLVEQFLDERSELKGAKKLATVLFADTVGSMEKTEGLSTEDVGSFLQPIKALMHEGVKRHEGIVTQVMGDGIMALFGFPIAREDDAVRAACAAIEIQQLFEQARSEGRFQKAREPHIRIGIHSGEVLMTAARNDLSVDLVVEGHTVNIASRIESLAKPGTACLTGQTLRLAEGLIHVQSLGQHLIDGHPVPIDLYELRGETGQSRYHAHQHSPWFLGRDGLCSGSTAR